ncbi:MAG TPA: acetamidase/formamidase family protein [Gemmatimonadaceae bacterium]|nr:acetamidase/formamidase family protein [Gemmatimonadaceae bacterium]
MTNSAPGILAVLAAAIPLTVTAQKPGKTHKLEASPTTVAYGYYSPTATPVLRVASGDIVEVTTMLTNTPDRLEKAGVAPNDIEPELREIVTKVTDKGPGGHILTGPIYVEGADSGDVLEVRILQITPKLKYAYNGCAGFLRSNCEQGAGTKIIPIDTKTMTAEFAPGIVIPLKPFFGSMGVAPAMSVGRISSNPPSTHAGNLDNKELVVGTTLYIPVHVAGALFEVGDGHVAQGDGEVDQTAIETSLRGKLQLIVRKDMKLTWPQAETPTHWITMGADTSLTQATKVAVQEMVDYLAASRGLSKTDAYRLASVAADLRITQLVDGNVGVHMMVPKSIFRKR